MLTNSTPWLTYISFPIVAALIGWITNAIAVKMLFRPRRPVRVLGITLQGLVPKRQKELAISIGETVESSLLTREDILSLIAQERMQIELSRLIEVKITKFLGELGATQPMLGMFLQGPLAEQVKQLLVTQLQTAMPEILAGVTTQLEQNLDLKEIVRAKVESFDLSTLEEIVQRISAKELKTIEILGGVLGFLVGLIQLAFMTFYP